MQHHQGKQVWSQMQCIWMVNVRCAFQVIASVLQLARQGTETDLVTVALHLLRQYQCSRNAGGHETAVSGALVTYIVHCDFSFEGTVEPHLQMMVFGTDPLPLESMRFVLLVWA